MKIIALIQAHKDLEQVNRLIRTLACEKISVYVNLDRKSDIDPLLIDGRAKLIKNRVEIVWGDYSMVQSILNSFEQIEREEDYGYLMLISGQDYPVWSNEKIARFFEGSDKKLYMACTPLNQDGWAEAAPRAEYYYYSGKSAALKVAYGLARKIMRLLSLKRRMPGGMTAYGGSMWFSLTRESVGHMLEFVGSNPEYVEFAKSVSIPDEMFFQTILANSKYREDIENNNFRYIDWSSRLPHPNFLTEADFDKIAASSMMFCRKIDAKSGLKLLEMLDAYRRES